MVTKDEIMNEIPSENKEASENKGDPTTRLEHCNVAQAMTSVVLNRDCLVCGGAKQIRKPIKKQTDRIELGEVGNQWNTDLAGPFRTRTRHGFRYFQVIQENRSRLGVLKLLKSKEEATSTFINQLEVAQVLWHRKQNRLLRVRLDNEITRTNEWKEWAREQVPKVESEPIPPSVSALGGVYESLVKTMKAMHKCMMLEARLAMTWSGYAYEYAMRLRNVLWHPATKLSPRTVAFPNARKPDISNYRVFGCLILIMDLEDKQGKSNPGIFLGLDGDTVVLAFDLVERRVRRVYHVNFYEQIMPGMGPRSLEEVLDLYGQVNRDMGDIDKLRLQDELAAELNDFVMENNRD